MTPQDLLRLHPFFTALSAQDAQELSKRTRSTRVPPGHILFQQGDAGDGLYGILAGRVAFTVDSVNGKGLILNVLGPGEFFGEIALVGHERRTASVRATTPVRAVVMHSRDFGAMRSAMPAVCNRIETAIRERLPR
jgi:CRP/FNR family transcriptional regulator, cyclic AMP receptor protein